MPARSTFGQKDLCDVLIVTDEISINLINIPTDMNKILRFHVTFENKIIYT
jgi:hypothetical protein